MDVRQALQVTLQSAAEGTGGVRKGSELLEGFCFPGDGKDTGSGGMEGHIPLFSGLRVMGTGDLTLRKQCPWTVVITAWRGKGQPRLVTCCSVLRKDSIS